jgi:hypothetical protein
MVERTFKDKSVTMARDACGVGALWLVLLLVDPNVNVLVLVVSHRGDVERLSSTSCGMVPESRRDYDSRVVRGDDCSALLSSGRCNNDHH